MSERKIVDYLILMQNDEDKLTDRIIYLSKDGYILQGYAFMMITTSEYADD